MILTLKFLEYFFMWPPITTLKVAFLLLWKKNQDSLIKRLNVDKIK